MKTKRQRVSGLQARAARAVDKQAQSRVIVTSETESSEDGTVPQTGGGVEIWLYGTVGGYWWGFDSDDVATALRNLGDVENITVRLHSFGGSAIEGIAIANLLANVSARVRVVVDGVAASAASMIALAGEELIMSPGSQIMVHEAWLFTAGNAAELRSEADFIDKQSQNYAETYAHRAGGTAAQWRERMLADNGNGTWYSAQEAVAAGLATRVANIASTATPPPVPDLEDDFEDLDMAAAALWDTEALIHPAARAAWTRRKPTTKPPTASAGGSITTQGTETAMAFTPEQLTTMRQDLGLAEDADEATIVAALSEALSERAEPEAAPPAVPEGHVVIPAAQWETTQSGAAAGTQASKELHAMKRDKCLEANKSKFPAALRESWAKQYDLDPEATTQALSEMADIIPVSEAGHADEGKADDPYAAIYGKKQEA